MFNDERINRICGGAYRRGILLAVLYTALFGVARAFITGFHLRLFLTELAVILTGIVILLTDLIRWGLSGDERADYERHTYYLTAGKVFVVAALLGYAISIPLRMRLTNDYPVNELILHLLTFGGVYFCYTFKRHQVGFNYTFAEESHSVYYRRVLLNIAKLAVILLIPFVLAAMLDLVMHQSFLYFLAILWGYVASTMGLGLDYLLLSVLERLNVGKGDADGHEDPRILRRGTMVAFWLFVGAQLVHSGLLITQAVVLRFPLTEVGRVLAAFSTAINRWSYPTLILMALAFCFLMEYVPHSRRVRVGVGGMLAVQGVDLALRVARSTAIVVIERVSDDPHVILTYTDVLSTMSFLFWLMLLGFTCVLIDGLVRDCGVTRLLWLTVGITVVCQALGIFLTAQNMTVGHALTVGLGGLAEAVLWPVCLQKRDRAGRG